MISINPYFNFPGNTEEAFNFYKSVFGGDFAMLMRFKDTPEAGKTPPQDLDKLMHIALPVGKGTVLMATDATESMGQKVVVGNNIHMAIHTDSESEADKIHGTLSNGGKVTLPMSKQFWGSYFGMVTDKFGIQWMISFDNIPAQN